MSSHATRLDQLLVISWLTTLGGCTALFNPNEYLEDCVTFFVDDVSITATPPDAFPADPFDLKWNERFEVPAGNPVPAEFSEVVESLSLRDPITDDVLVALPDRIAPPPIQDTFGGGLVRGIEFSEFTSAPGFVPRDYTFHVEVHQMDGAEAECFPPDPALDVAGEFELVPPCDCGGYYAFGLEVQGATTDPPSPIPSRAPIDLTWTNAFDGFACAGADPVSSGAFQASVQVNGPDGADGVVLVDVASLVAGTATVQTVPLTDIIGPTWPAGSYEVTLILDPFGVVPECTSQGEVDSTDQIVQFAFDVAS